MRTPAAPAPALIALAALAGTLHAEDLFRVQVTQIGNPANSLLVTGNTLPDLVSDLADQQGLFSGFSNVPFASSLTYAGIPDAVAVSYNPTGGTNGGELITITSLLGTTQTFTFDEANGNLGNQLEDFFVKDNPGTISDFLQAVARRSLVAVTDGNPLASTARAADLKWRYFGLSSDLTLQPHVLRGIYPDSTLVPDSYIDPAGGLTAAGDDPTASTRYDGSRLISRIDFQYNATEAEGFEANGYTISTSTEFILFDAASIAFSSYINYTQLEDADVFHGGFAVDLPIRIIQPDIGTDSGFWLTLIPGTSFNASGSYDLAAGGILWSGGATLATGVDFGRLRFAGAAQYTVHRSVNIEYDDYEFDPGVEQEILKLGAKVSYIIAEPLVLETGVTWTDFLQDAAVDNYLTPHAGVALVFSNGAALRLSGKADLADNFDRYAGELAFVLPF